MLQGLFGLGLLLAFPMASIISLIDYLPDGCYQGLVGRTTCGDQARNEILVISAIGFPILAIILLVGRRIIRKARQEFLAAPIGPEFMPSEPKLNLAQLPNADLLVDEWATDSGYRKGTASSDEKIIYKKYGVGMHAVLVVFDKPKGDLFIWVEGIAGPAPIESVLQTGLPGRAARKDYGRLVERVGVSQKFPKSEKSEF